MWLATAGPLSQLPDARDADVDAMLDAEYRLASLFWHGAADSADDGAAAALDEIEIAPWVNIPQEGPGCAVLFGGSGGVFTGMGRRLVHVPRVAGLFARARECAAHPRAGEDERLLSHRCADSQLQRRHVGVDAASRHRSPATPEEELGRS